MQLCIILVDTDKNIITCKTTEKPVGDVSVIEFRKRFYGFHRFEFLGEIPEVIFMEIDQPVQFSVL